MLLFRNILIAAVGLAVIFSGCAGPFSKTSAPGGLSTAVQTSGYQLSLGVTTIEDCIVYSGTTQSCSQVNLDIRNANPQSLNVAVVKNILVMKNGITKEMYENVGGLSTTCVRRTGLLFNLSANSNKNLAMCYPLVHKSDAPILEITVMMNGVRNDYSFDLTKYGLT